MKPPARTLLALLCAASLLPITLTQASQPSTPDAPRLVPSLAWGRGHSGFLQG